MGLARLAQMADPVRELAAISPLRGARAVAGILACIFLRKVGCMLNAVLLLFPVNYN